MMENFFLRNSCLDRGRPNVGHSEWCYTWIKHLYSDFPLNDVQTGHL